jgi:addiction module RelE/StbE family toxin
MAQKDLLEIKDYIAEELDNPASALKVISKILESMINLKKFPMLGSDLSPKIYISTDYRYLISGNYIVFYRIENQYISVDRILYGKRDYLKIIFSGEIIESERLEE